MTEPLNILVATDLTDESLDYLRETGVNLMCIAPSDKAVREHIKNAHAIIIRNDVALDEELINSAPLLKVIGRVSARLDGIDIETATARGIIVMNTPGTSAIAAGEHAFALMLALSRRLIVVHNSLRDGWWLLDRRRQAGTQLQGKTLGIVGYGRVGRVVGHRALAFGMNVLAYDPYISEEQVSDERVFLVGLQELLERSDYVSLHVPATRETTGMVDETFIQKMRPGARIINTSFGALWDENAVADALKDGHLGGVGVDVYNEEPPYNSPLLGHENIIHTPHVGENTIEATQDLSLQIVRQVMDALSQKDYRNVINLPFVAGVSFEQIRPYLELAEHIGTLLHLFSRQAIHRIAVEYRGDEVTGLVKPLTVAILTGLLKPILGESVSYINAPVIAAERGIQVTQAKGLKTGDYTNIVSCRVILDDKEEITISGTLLDRKQPHIIQINQYRMNFVPEGHLLIIGSYDKPGVIGQVGTLLSEADVNIASWQTGRAERGGQTLTVLTLDHPAPEDVFNALLERDFIRHAHQIKMS